MTRIHSDDMIESVRKLWMDGKTATEIGAAIGSRRSVVIGIVHRNKIKRADMMNHMNRREGGRKTNKQRWRDKPRKTPRPIVFGKGPKQLITRKDIAAAIKPEPYLVMPDDPPKVRSVESLENHHCRWPVGDPRDSDSFGFCGNVRLQPFSYCRKHVLRSSQTVQSPAPANDIQPRQIVVEAAE